MHCRFSPRSATLAAVAALALVAPSLAAGNLLVNPGFEDGGGSYSGWTTFGSGVQLSLPLTDMVYHSGSAAAKVFGEFTGCPDAGVFTVGGFFQAFTPAVGQVYTFSGWSYVGSFDPLFGTDPCVSNRAIAKVVFYDDPTLGGSVHEICSNEVIIGDGNTVRDQWHRWSVSIPAPANAQRVEALILFLQPACGLGSVFVDDLSLDTTTAQPPANLLANASFDGGLTGWSTFGNVYYDGRSFARRTPTGSAKLFSTFNPGSDSGIYQSFPAVAGSLWHFGVHTMTTCVESPINGANDNFLAGTIVFKDGGGVEIGSQQTIMLDNSAPMGTWTWHEMSATAPAMTATVEVYVLFVSPSLMGGAAWIDDAVLTNSATSLTGVPEGPTPAAARLAQNVPNPFNPETRIGFELARAQDVQLTIYDLAGRRVATLLRGQLEAGPHQVKWNGRTDAGLAAPAGIYRYVLRTEGGQLSRSMILLK